MIRVRIHLAPIFARSQLIALVVGDIEVLRLDLDPVTQLAAPTWSSRWPELGSRRETRFQGRDPDPFRRRPWVQHGEGGY
jgi:hypothetical protein